MSIKETIIKLEKERDVFPKGTGPYQKYQNAINALNKMKKIKVLQTTAWDTPEELELMRKGVAEWLNERRSKKTSKKPIKTNKP
jgi:hypothetical protein